MEIKCPKCKYRFEEAIEPYENEHSCVCPRCGTPFVFTQTTESEAEKDTAKDKNASSDTASGASNRSGSNGSTQQRTHSQITKEDLRQMRENRMRRTINFHGDAYDPYRRHHHHHRRRKNRRLSYFIVIAAVLVLGLIVLTKGCGNDYEKVVSPENKALYEAEEQPIDSLNELFQDPKDVPVETAPAWIQGKWVAHVRGYDIVVYISEDKITEVNKSYHINGTFVCKQQKLVCRFGSGNIFVYTLDPVNHTIDCGSGIIMQKAN